MRTVTKVIRWLVLGLIVFAGLVVLMLSFETYLVYPAPRADVGDYDATRLGAEEVWFESQDGTQLHGWLFAQDGNRHRVVFFHGNGENVALVGPEAQLLSRLLGADILLFDYRGYGKSEGSPHEKGVVADGVAAVNWMSNRYDIDANQVVYLGRSLGGGVAVQICADMPPRALILVSNFSSMVDVAAGAFPWLPVRWLMRNRYDSVSAIANCQSALLQIHGTRDRMIPIALGEKLFAASPCEAKAFIRAEGFGHNDLALEEYASEIRQFLDGID
ncbi:MAG: alpha/beta hydrolase [Pirellulaceae bacterium]